MSKALFERLWEEEYERTQQVIAAIPPEHMEQVPHAGAMTLRRLALHVVMLEDQFIRGVAQGKLVAGGSRRDIPEVATPTDLARYFEKQHEALRPVLAALTDDSLSRPVPFYRPDGALMYAAPGLSLLFSALLHHMIHHRGQLLAHLRAIGAPIPGLYGPVREQTPPMP